MNTRFHAGRQSNGRLPLAIRISILSGLFVGLLACGGSESSHSTPLDPVSADGCISADHLKEGLSWELEYKTPKADEKVRVEGRVVGPVQFNGQNVVQIDQRMQIYAGSVDDGDWERRTSYQTFEGTLPVEYGFEDFKDTEHHSVITYQQPRVLEHWRLQAGKEKEYKVDMLHLHVATGDNSVGKVSQTWFYHGRGTVKIPAGTFKNACKFTIKDGEIKSTQWFAEGTGLPIKVESASGGSVQELMSGRFDDQVWP